MADLRKATNLDEQVIAAVVRRTPDSANHRIVNVQQHFLEGILYTVLFEGVPDPAGNRPTFTNRVYVTRNAIETYGHDEALLQIVGARHSRSAYDVFANSDVVSGIIALIVTLFIVANFIVSYRTATLIPVPEYITSGWLLILGFYFGKASGRTD
ncbi:hypothetical protein P9272_32725 [Mesorhizobium sp. WSM4976]|uniref:hypothetical protein n=1 Tax=Mesorhizobium sp. WSM4976 TaxID=3038549 RepID=UPI002415F6B2|nr:hypothetical protein [Mesorhizobium sp. WSM4976]MDG4898300.1 hypothetical protein [Mesorhizobium sp. WSM4976]